MLCYKNTHIQELLAIAETLIIKLLHMIPSDYNPEIIMIKYWTIKQTINDHFLKKLDYTCSQLLMLEILGI